MAGSDPLDDLGLKACPNCLEQMQPAGSLRQFPAGDVMVAEGSVFWKCSSCGLAAVA